MDWPRGDHGAISKAPKSMPDQPARVRRASETVRLPKGGAQPRGLPQSNT
jgi:hypothetical protein